MQRSTQEKRVVTDKLYSKPQNQVMENNTEPTKGNNDNNFLLKQFREMSKTVENLQSLMTSHLTLNQPPSNHLTQEQHHLETQMPQNQPAQSSYTPPHYPTETLMIQNQPPPNYYTQVHCPTASQTSLNQCPPNPALPLDSNHQFLTQEHYLAHQLQQIQQIHQLPQHIHQFPQDINQPSQHTNLYPDQHSRTHQDTFV